MSANKQDLVVKFAEKMEITKKDSDKYVTGLFDLIEDITIAEGKLQVIGHGTYSIKDVAARDGISKLGGVEKPWHNDACKKPAFSPGKNFKEKCN